MQNFLNSFFSNNHLIMLLVDPHDGKIIDANQAAVKYYRYLKTELVGKHIYEINMLAEEEVKRAMQRAKTLGHKRFDFTHRLGDGSFRNVEVYSGPIVLKGRQLLYSVIFDVTARKMAQKALEESERQYRQEMTRAVAIQRQRLDLDFPLKEKVKMEVIYQSARTLSGDFFEFQKINEDRAIGFLGDASGKGVSAALSISALKVLFHQCAFINEPVKILNFLNAQIGQYMQDEYVAACCFCFDFRKQVVQVASAGINKFMISNEGYLQEKLVHGAYLGMFTKGSFEVINVSFKKGDRFYFYTDGFEDIFSDRSIKECCQMQSLTAQKIFLNNRLFKEQLKDDCTLLALEIGGENE